MEALQYHYQYQTHNDANSESVSLSYNPSQVQSYDQSTQPYYAYHHHHYNQPQQQLEQDYSSYYYSDYSNSHSTHHTQNDLNSIHPPGVPIPAETQQSHPQNTHNFYHEHGGSATQPPPSQGYMLPSHSTQSGRGNQSLRGGGRGTFGRHGRQRSEGRGKPPSGSSASTVATPSKPPPQKARCELCKVDCNTLEILEQHKNGKKHKKNLKVHEELQKLSRQQTAGKPQMAASRSNPENVDSSKPEGSASKPASAEAKAGGASGKDETPRTKPSSGAPPSEKSVRTDRLISRGGFKRSMRGGRGGKLMKAHDGSRRPAEPLKPGLGFPLICELCNVTCESQVVYESHIAGKKHLTNAKRFQGNKGALGGGLQALYPSIPNVASASIVSQVHQQGSQDAQALASMILSQQNLQDPQAAQAALAQLLNQHGIHDAQTLFVQLIPYLLAQSQVSGLLAASVAGFRMVDAQNPQSQGVAFPAGAGSQFAVTGRGPQQQDVKANAEIEQGMQQNHTSDYGKSLDKPIERASENNNVGSEQVPSTTTREEQALSEQEKQSS